ncbi:hypothetical protein [Bythopirellula goksoeyrii]|uniref:Uncharacterized protein n=1 Tax=Bythopirellula goksoeyrii TaxID=1400387 RepID=A0A5B9QFC1_9BACT|nr:hypothetical protein [Bythopirellula goksoeyrii]QEG36242.1 hypothetical protein Pr1d_35540 [Bythopirellula goksoeyrii]
MTKQRTPVSPIVKIGQRTAYQIFSAIVGGRQRLSARLGIYWVNPRTGQAVIIPEMDLWNYEEQTRARQAAKKHLEKLTADFFQNQPTEVQYVNQATSNLPQPTREEKVVFRGKGQACSKPRRPSTPPKPYPDPNDY